MPIKIHLEMTRQVGENALSSTVATALASIVIFFVLYDIVPTQWLMLWFAIQTILLYCRYYYSMVFKHFDAEDETWSKAVNHFTWAMFFIGLGWGMVSVLIARYGTLLDQVMVLAILLGIVGAAIGTLAPVLRAYRVFLLGAMGPQGLVFLHAADEQGLLLGSLTMIYSIVVYRAGETLATNIMNLVEVREDLATRSRDLSKAQEESHKNYEELKKTYDSLKETQVKLVQSAKLASIGQLAAGVAHEINNPLAFVNSNLLTMKEYLHLIKTTVYALPLSNTENQLQEDIDTLRAQFVTWKELFESQDISEVIVDSVDLINETHEGCIRIADIVKNLTQFSRQAKPEKEECDLNACIENTLKITFNQFKYKCKLEMDLGKIATIYANIGELNQVLLNLIVNAGQSITDNGTINIKTLQNAENIIISIADSGVGIPTNKQAHIFTPFYTTKPVGEGTGLGLSISYGIIKAHGGELNFTSEVDKGTTFTISLPATMPKMVRTSSGID
jgi:signal transduction histidine kinase